MTVVAMNTIHATRIGCELHPVFKKKHTRNTMKKALKTILAVACVTGIILAGCEEPDGSCNIIWTLSWLSVAVASGLGLKRMGEAK